MLGRDVLSRPSSVEKYQRCRTCAIVIQENWKPERLFENYASQQMPVCKPLQLFPNSCIQLHADGCCRWPQRCQSDYMH